MGLLLSSALVNTQARLINSLGVVVKSFMIKGTGNQAVNVSNLKGGVYIVKITENGNTATRKLIIK